MHRNRAYIFHPSCWSFSTCSSTHQSLHTTYICTLLAGGYAPAAGVTKMPSTDMLLYASFSDGLHAGVNFVHFCSMHAKELRVFRSRWDASCHNRHPWATIVHIASTSKPQQRSGPRGRLLEAGSEPCPGPESFSKQKIKRLSGHIKIEDADSIGCD
jgi:hypothetical protein